MSDTCPECGSEATRQSAPYEFQHGGSTLSFQDDHFLCGSCEAVFYEGEQISRHEHAKAEAIRRSEGLLTPSELRNIRLKYQMTQTDMEQLLSTGPKTWTRWERGKIVHSKSTDMLLRVFASEPAVARCMVERAGISNEAARAELAKAELEVSSSMRTRIAGQLGPVGASETRLVERVTEIAVLVSREGLCASLSGAQVMQGVCAA